MNDEFKQRRTALQLPDIVFEINFACATCTNFTALLFDNDERKKITGSISEL